MKVLHEINRYLYGEDENGDLLLFDKQLNDKFRHIKERTDSLKIALRRYDNARRKRLRTTLRELMSKKVKRLNQRITSLKEKIKHYRERQTT